MVPPEKLRMRAHDYLRGNVLWLSIVSLLNDAASEMIYPLLPLFLVGTLGASMAFVGLVEGVAESASSFLKLASGWWSDRVRRRKPLVLWGYGIATVARPLIALASAPWHVLAIRFGDRIGKGMRSAPRDALLAESVPQTHRGRAFGVHRAADHFGAVLGPLIASALLLLLHDRLRLVFALALIPGVIALVVLLTRVHEPAAVPAATSTAVKPTNATPAAATPAAFLSIFRGSLAHFLIAIGIFTLGNATDAFLLLRATDLGVPIAAVPLLWGVHHVSKMAWSVPGGALADRLGPRTAIISGWLIYAATYAGFALASAAWHIWLLFIVYGLFYGLTESPEKALVARLAPAALRGAAYGAYHFTIGLTALPASLLFGLLWQHFGPRTAFLTGAAFALVAAIVLVPSSGCRLWRIWTCAIHNGRRVNRRARTSERQPFTRRG